MLGLVKLRCVLLRSGLFGFASLRSGMFGPDRARQDLELYTLGVARRDRLSTLTLSLKKR